MLERLQVLLGHFARQPRVRQALDTVRVGVLRRGEPAVVEEQLAEHVLDGALGDRAVPLLARHEPAVEIHRHEQRVVVKHLLEVRHEPVVVDRVAVEAAADDVVHAPRGHRVERRRHHLQLATAEEELEDGMRRELGRPPEPAGARVEHGPEVAHGLDEQRLGERLARRAAARRLFDRRDQLSCGARDVAAALA